MFTCINNTKHDFEWVTNMRPLCYGVPTKYVYKHNQRHMNQKCIVFCLSYKQ